jgi:hypothetical protein
VATTGPPWRGWPSARGSAWGPSTTTSPTDLELERFVGDDPRAAIARWLRRAYERQRKEPSLYVVVLGLADRDPEVRRRFLRIEQAAIGRLREFIEFGQRPP